VLPSGGTVGKSYDNAMAEALNGTFKAEVIHRLGPRKTRTDAEIATYKWISEYNHARLHSSIGDIPPAEHEARYYASLNTQPPACV
jgi:transposase InsO family protein